MRRCFDGIGAMALCLVVAGPAAFAAPTPPPRPAEFSRPEADVPLPPRRPAEFFSRDAKAPLPPWRPLKRVDLARLTPQEAPRLTDAPGLDLKFAAPVLPGPPAATAEETEACDQLFAGKKAVATRLAPIAGLNGCGVAAPVSLERVNLADGRSIRLEPPPVMRCALAAATVSWLAEGVIPALEKQGGRVTRVLAAGGYQCRNRNNAVDGKLSEHAHGDAFDVLGVQFEDGHMLHFFALDNDMAVAQALRETTCARFATVLGPGSDGAHEAHIHVDLEARRHGGKLCEWNLR